VHCSPGRPGRAAGKRESQRENGLGKAMAAETGHPWALRHPDAGIDAYLRTASARKPHGLRTIPQKTCGDCAVTALKLHDCHTISTQPPYGFVPISSPRDRTKKIAR